MNEEYVSRLWKLLTSKKKSAKLLGLAAAVPFVAVTFGSIVTNEKLTLTEKFNLASIALYSTTSIILVAAVDPKAVANDDDEDTDHEP